MEHRPNKVSQDLSAETGVMCVISPQQGEDAEQKV